MLAGSTKAKSDSLVIRLSLASDPVAEEKLSA